MVHTCKICNLSSKDNKDLSFYKFPKSLEKRQKWASVLEVQQIGNWHYVCGNHFNSDSYVFSNTRKILKSNAILFIVQNSDDESCSLIICTSASNNYSHVNAVNSSPNILNNNMHVFNVVHNSDDESCSQIICTFASDNYSHYRTPKRRKIELTCDVTTPKICPHKKLIWSSNRFGDLSVSDFGTPNCAKRNFKVIKTTVAQLRKKKKI